MVSFYDPKLEQEAKRRRRMAQQVLKNSDIPSGTDMVSGIAIPRSPLELLAKTIQQGVGSYQERKADELDTQIAGNRQSLLAQAVGSLEKPKEAAGMLMQDPTLAPEGFKMYADAVKGDRDEQHWQQNADLQRELLSTRLNGQAGIDPATGLPINPKLSAGAEKELFDTVDIVNSGQGALSDLKRAQALASGLAGPNGTASKAIYSGTGSDTAVGLNRVPILGGLIDDERATNTTEYNNLVTGQALSSLKSIFGGNPTEGERSILLDMQAMSNKTDKEQAKILRNAHNAVQRRIAFNQQKAEMIQTGNRAGLVNLTIPTEAPTAPGSVKPPIQPGATVHWNDL